MSENSEAQKDELLALSSIFGETFQSFSCDSKEGCNDDSGEKALLRGGELKVTLQLPQPFYVTFLNNISGNLEKHPLHHLPPLYLYFTFPENYPSHSPPEYTLSCKWISRVQLSLLCQRLDELWEQNYGSEVMFTWSQCLKEETLNLLNISDSLMVSCGFTRRRSSSDQVPVCQAAGSDNKHEENSSDINVAESLVIDPRTMQDISPHTNLLRLLREYDAEMRKVVFDSKLYACKVCFNEKVGSNCIEFWPCQHVYCKDCMRSYFEVQINEGNIKYLKCPEDKCDSEANPKQVENLVSNELYSKWDSMLLNSTLLSLGDIQLCPRQHCQYPVTIEDTQGQCPSCTFVFCGLCRFGWHGLEKCKLKSGEAKKIVQSYMNGKPEEKRNLDSKYGKKYLNMLVEEFLSASYLDENAKECPRCRTKIEKIDGCNKMTCNRCSTNFCWLCEKYLDRMNPYHHFNNPNSECFNMLFHGINNMGEFEDFIDDDDFEFED